MELGIPIKKKNGAWNLEKVRAWRIECRAFPGRDLSQIWPSPVQPN